MTKISVHIRLRWVVAFFAAHACGAADAPPAPPARLLLTASAAPPGFTAGPLGNTAPEDNALTEARALLGKRLFYDPVLSRDRTISCSNCHRQAHAFADATATSKGIDGQKGARNASALVNLAWSTTLFWDGRAKSLEAQVGQPIENPVEMGLTLATAVERLNSDTHYLRLFDEAYAAAPSELTLRKALASFVRTLVSGGSDYDRHMRGDDGALTDSARRGEALFFGEAAGCFHCHPAGSLTNDGFFNNGTFLPGADPGRQVVTGRFGDLGRFRVPGLRNVAASAPYMHDGSLATLTDVIAHYAAGGRPHASTDPQVVALTLSPTDQHDLVAFLQALTDESFLSDERFAP